MIYGHSTEGGGGKASRAANEVRVERATNETTLSVASVSVGVLREPQPWRVGFTMAEILLSLTIIGVVAAITLPSLTGNINERTWNTQRKALYARFSQAIALMPSINGFGILEDGDPNNVAETFVTSGLAKVLKINNICSADDLANCGIPEKVTTIDGKIAFTSFPTTLVGFNSMFDGVPELDGSAHEVWSYSQLDTKAAAFETQNGESIVAYYSPACKFGMNETQVAADGKRFFNAQTKICANFVYDLNGKKGPNTVGKDIGFITVLYPTDSVVVAPMPLNKEAGSGQHENAASLCKAIDSESRIPNQEELLSIFCNRILVDGDAAEDANTRYWSSSLVSSEKAWGIHLLSGHTYAYDRTSNLAVRCVKR